MSARTAMRSPSLRRLSAGHRSVAGGFTLVEILVVVVIIGVLSAGFVLSLSLAGGRDNELQKESTRLYDLMNYAREQAELQTRQYGIIFQDDSYEFVSYDVHRQQWRSIFEDDILRLRHLPYGLDVKLKVETRPVVLKKPADAKDKTPQVMIFASGDLTQFELTLERDSGLRYVIINQDDKGALVKADMVDTTVQDQRK